MPFTNPHPLAAPFARRAARAAVLGLAFAALSALPAAAAGGTTRTEDKATECERGEVYSDREKRCVPEDSAAATEADRFETGRALAHAGRLAEAIALLDRADANSADVQNYLGFAHRKAGRLDRAVEHYRLALAIDPNHTLARSYLGQAMLASGDREGAREQLRRIRAATGPVSLEYVILRDAIAAGGAGGY